MMRTILALGAAVTVTGLSGCCLFRCCTKSAKPVYPPPAAPYTAPPPATSYTAPTPATSYTAPPVVTAPPVTSYMPTTGYIPASYAPTGT